MFKTYNRISKYIKNTPLEYNIRLSKKLNNNIFLKREDLQLTRSFKIRGSLNKMLLQNMDEKRQPRFPEREDDVWYCGRRTFRCSHGWACFYGSLCLCFTSLTIFQLIIIT